MFVWGSLSDNLFFCYYLLFDYVISSNYFLGGSAVIIKFVHVCVCVIFFFYHQLKILGHQLVPAP